MNATINGYIDMLFKDTMDSAETVSLREELQNNCQEHYNDLIARGLSETEAIDAVIESLNGMKEIIDEYPRKPGSEEKINNQPDPSAEDKSHSPEPDKSDIPKDRCYCPDEILYIHTDLRSGDLTIGHSDDGMIHVRCEEPEQLIVEKKENRLSVRVDSEWQKISRDQSFKIDNINVRNIMNLIGNVLNKVAADMKSTSAHVFIDLPDGITDELNLNSMSGNIDIEDCQAKKITMHSTSGDLMLKAPSGSKIDHFTASSASGDIFLYGNAEQIEMNSISGDVRMEGDCRTVRLKSTSGDNMMKGCAKEISTHTISGKVMIHLENIDVRRIDSASTSGNVDIELPSNISGVHANMRSVSGRISCAFPDAGSDADLQISASTVSGNVRIS